MRKRQPAPREPIETGLGPATDRWVNRILVGENGQEAIIFEKVVTPLTGAVRDYVMPYIYIGLLMYLILVLLLVYLVYSAHRKRSPTIVVWRCYEPGIPGWGTVWRESGSGLPAGGTVPGVCRG